MNKEKMLKILEGILYLSVNGKVILDKRSGTDGDSKRSDGNIANK